MKKLHKNFYSMKQTVETMAGYCGCPCDNCGCSSSCWNYANQVSNNSSLQFPTMSAVLNMVSQM